LAKEPADKFRAKAKETGKVVAVFSAAAAVGKVVAVCKADAVVVVAADAVDSRFCLTEPN